LAIVQSTLEAADTFWTIGNSLPSPIAISNFVRGQQHESEETRREEANGVEAQAGGIA
jgi:hypothetical protein